jgi:hypothetical protein
VPARVEDVGAISEASPKSTNLEDAVLPDDEVRGLDVPVQEPARVHEPERTRGLDQIVERAGLVAARQGLAERRPLDELHGEERHAGRGVAADVEELNEVGVLQAREQGELVARTAGRRPRAPDRGS